MCDCRSGVLSDEILKSRRRNLSVICFQQCDASHTSPSPVPEIPMPWTLRFPLSRSQVFPNKLRCRTHSSAQNPEPMSGVSPMRPTSLFVRPPVEVTTAMQPRMSSATAPTVPFGKRSSKSTFSASGMLSTSTAVSLSENVSSSSGKPSPRQCSFHLASVQK